MQIVYNGGDSWVSCDSVRFHVNHFCFWRKKDSMMIWFCGVCVVPCCTRLDQNARIF